MRTQSTFRRVSIDELPKLAELFTAFDNDAFIADRRRKLEDGSTAIFALEHDGRFVAELTAHLSTPDSDADFAEPGKRAYLFALRVLPEFQGRGHAQSLILQVLGELEQLGYSEATIGVEDDNDIAKHIYAKLGFTEFVRRCSETFQVDSFEFNLYLKRFAIASTATPLP